MIGGRSDHLDTRIVVKSRKRIGVVFVTMAFVTAWMVAIPGRAVHSFSWSSRLAMSTAASGSSGTKMSRRMTSHTPRAASAVSPRAMSSRSGSSFAGGFSLLPKALLSPEGECARKRRSYGASSLTMMPEGPEVRTLVDQLRGGIGKRLVDFRFLSGRYLGKRPVGFAGFAKTMTPLSHNATAATTTSAPTKSSGGGSSVDTILDWSCKGKFIYILLDDGMRASETSPAENDDEEDYQRSIWITLGMTGRFVNEKKHLEDPSHGRWVLELYDDGSANASAPSDESNLDSSSTEPPTEERFHRIYYHDRRNFGTVKFSLSKSELDQKLKSLGPDVLAMAREISAADDPDDPSITIDDELDAQEAEASATASFLEVLEKQRNPRINVCKFLMDQKKIAGVGNYILSEALYRASIDPFCGIDELSASQRIGLFREIRAVSLESYRSQQISTNPSTGVGTGYTSVKELTPFDFELRVYRNTENCPAGNPVIRETNGPHGRTIWYTEAQLFMGRDVRELRERQQQEELLQQRQKTTKSTGDEPYTITRKNGKEVFGAKTTDSTNAIGGKEKIPEADTTTKGFNLLDGITDPGWKNALEPFASSSQSFADLQNFLEQEYSGYGRDQIYPPPHQIFAALNLCPLDKVKLMILGQDPYHGPNQANGLAFSVSKKVSKIPPSLQNIFRELDDDYYPLRNVFDDNGNSNDGPSVGRNLEARPPEIRHGDLQGWAKQGVLLLNTVLTVRRGQANSHQRKGWEDFTDEIVRILQDQNASGNGNRDGSKGIVFLLWGGPASKKAKSITTIDSDQQHVVIATSHPSPLGATKTASPFLTSKCFSRANAALTTLGHEAIDWYKR